MTSCPDRLVSGCDCAVLWWSAAHALEMVYMQTSICCLAFDVAKRECPGPNPSSLTAVDNRAALRIFPVFKVHVGAAVDLHNRGFCCLCVGMCASCSVRFGTSHCY